DCHNQPAIGGGGGFVSNVFVMAQNLNPVTDSVSPEISNERNTLGMNGSGAIEMLSREMTADLQGIRDTASREAIATGCKVTKALETKGVNFGRIVAHADGGFDLSGVQGVDPDLVIKPFSQKGVVNSIRVFTVNAFNQHHGMEAVERFGAGQLDSHGNAITTNDFDGDGVPDELSVGDVTAATVFQAALNVPGRVLSDDPTCRAAARAGEALFSQIGCTDCHIPSLTLKDPKFSEPNPYNGPGNFRVQDASHPFIFDLTRDIPTPRLACRPGGGAIVHAYTDLKRHVIADAQDPFFANEKVRQSGVPVDQFITRKLWDVGCSAPYGHRGDLTTITEAILHHAGEARRQRERFAALSQTGQSQIIEFMKQLQVLPPGSPWVVTEAQLNAMLRYQKRVPYSHRNKARPLAP
ncbi:MAG: di-heme oxidoredictase family protein, partial [Blastocatellia bacterium]